MFGNIRYSKLPLFDAWNFDVRPKISIIFKQKFANERIQNNLQNFSAQKEKKHNAENPH